MTLSLDTAYRSFGGEVEASSTPTICRLPDSRRHQLWAIAHSPVLMAYPNATLLRLTKYGLEPVTVKETDHYKVMREFCEDPAGFAQAAIEEGAAEHGAEPPGPLLPNTADSG